MITINQIQKWMHDSMQLKAYKKVELQGRKEICTEVFQGRTGKFTETLKQDGFKIKAYSNVDVKFDSDDQCVMDLLEQFNDVGMKQAMFNAIGISDLIDAECDCVKVKIELSKTNLKLIPDDSFIYDMIIEREVTPTLEITAIEE